MRYLTLLGICLLLLTSCGSPSGSPIAQQPSPTAQQPSPTTATPEPSPSPSPSAASTPTLVATQPVPTNQPAPTTAPTNEPSPSPTTAPASERDIMLDAPTTGASVSNSITIKGETNYWPFEANLTAQLKDAGGNVLAIIPVTVNAPDIGQGGPFETQMTFTPPAQAQAGTLEVFEASAKDGSIVAIETVKVQLSGGGKPSGSTALKLDAPVEGQSITLPLHVAFRDAQPNETLTGRLRFGNGEVLEQDIPVVTGSDNIGYGVANIDWNTESQPPAVPPGITTFELVGADGTVRQSVSVRLLAENETQRVEVAWTTPEGDDIVFTQAIQRTPQIATAALKELLQGPADGNLAGAVTALPTVKDIVTFPGRQPDWGYEVKLIKLTITNGIATANFSKELRAYGGGSARVQAIRQQIERTLKQFSSVQSVVIQIEGQSADALQP